MSSRYRQVEKYQKLLYLGKWNTDELLTTLDLKIEDCYDDSESLLEVIYLLKVLKETKDKTVADRLRDIIDSHTDFWIEDAGIIVVLEILDILVSFKRNQDIDYLSSMMVWDLFQIPSHIFLLIRRYGWIDLWNHIASIYDFSYEYDDYMRTQFFETREAADTLSDLNFTPIIYVEGKTDKEILRTAWKKLYDNKVMPFRLRDCDLMSGSTGGVGTLSRLISAVRSDSPYLVINSLRNKSTTSVEASVE